MAKAAEPAIAGVMIHVSRDGVWTAEDERHDKGDEVETTQEIADILIGRSDAVAV